MWVVLNAIFKEDTMFIEEFFINREEAPRFLQPFFCKRDNKFLNASSKHLYFGRNRLVLLTKKRLYVIGPKKSGMVRQSPKENETFHLMSFI